MPKTITIKIPLWPSEEEVIRIIEEDIAKLSDRISVDELRRGLPQENEA